MNHHSRPTIAFLTNYFGKNILNYSIWSGIYRMVNEEDVNMFCFPWNPLARPCGFLTRAEVIFTLVNRKRIDGLIIWGGGLWGNATDDDIRTFYKRLSDFPAISIGPGMEGMPSIAIDNYKGMYDACIHLVEYHSCRRIAFLGGPENHTEAEVRFKAYKDALEKNHVPLDPDLIVRGNLSRLFGSESIRILLDKRKKEFDAIVSANDFMALGAFEELEARKIKVPGEVKIAGFDDIEESRFSRSPLTTVRQPFDEMGGLSVKLILSILRGESVEELTTIPAQLLIRQSCGCLNPSTFQSSGELKEFVFVTEQGDTLLQKDKILPLVVEEMGLFYNGKVDTQLIETIIDAIIREFVYNEKDTFLTTLNHKLLYLNTENEIVLLNTLLSILRRVILSFIFNDAKLVIKAENLFHRARIMIVECNQRLLKFESLKKEYEHEVLQDIYQKMIVTFKIEEFMNIVARYFPLLGIKSCFIALYENPSESLEKSLLKLAYIGKKRVDVTGKQDLFSSYEIIPDEFLPGNERFIFIVEFLFFEDEQLGYIVFGEDFLLGPVYEVIRTQLGAAIKGALLIQEKEKLLINLEKHTHHLQIMMDKIKHSNEELEQFFFIVSHDLKEPLRKILIFSNRLKDQFKNTIDDKNLDYLERLGSAVDRMQILIDNLLDYYRLTTRIRPFCSVDLSQVVKNVLNDLEILIEKKKAFVTCTDLPVIDAEPHQMQHLFLNFLSNALKFHKPGEPPVIRIHHKMSKEHNVEYCEIIIEDKGIGIEERYFDSIFAVFHRLHGRNEYEGTGIGLAICKKIVDRHQGHIKVKSELGKGSQFTIVLPVKQVSVELKS
ncbi:MAG: substrate-binding domain-containing protein [Spirochaetales bacterium]|nr:substrate-binding domain-containing protein [Spirochaetales bacterium]